jgi:zinc protease
LIALTRQGGDAMKVAAREGMIWHFQGHPYGRDPLQGLKTIPSIGRNDLKDFLEKHFVPSNMVAAISGDIEKDKALAGLRDLFQALPHTGEYAREFQDPTESPPVLVFIPKPGQVQTQIRLALPGVKRTHPAYWKISLLMNIFGGNDSLMYHRLRDGLGLAYVAGFYQTYKWKAGMLVGYIGCKGDNTSRAIRETVEIMKALQKDVPREELEQKRLDALNSFVFNVDTAKALVNVYGHYYMREEPLDTLERIQDAFMGATREDLVGLARQFLDPKKLQIFVVGDKSIGVKKKDGTELTLEQDMLALAKGLGLPYQEIQLR